MPNDKTQSDIEQEDTKEIGEKGGKSQVEDVDFEMEDDDTVGKTGYEEEIGQS